MSEPVRLLLEDLDDSGRARQAMLLATHLPQVTLHSLQSQGPMKEILASQGLAVESIDLRSSFRLNAWKQLRRAFSAADFLHVWGLKAFRKLSLSRCDRVVRPVILSLTGHEKLNQLDHFFWKNVRQVYVPHEQARRALYWQRIPPSQISVVPYAVEMPPAKPTLEERATFLRSLGIPLDAFVLMTNGRMLDRRRLSQAIWAFEVFRFTDPQVHCLVVGEGPGRAELETFSRQIGYDDFRVHFLGHRPDAPQLWRYADAAVMTHPTGGLQATLEAMAAGLPILATRTPDFTSLLEHEQTGLLVPPGDHPALAAAIRTLRIDPELRKRLGTNAREKASSHFALQPILSQWETIYTAVDFAPTKTT